MRLLYVCSDYGIQPSGTKGASVHLRAITRALSDLGHEVLFLSPREGPGADHPIKQILPGGCPSADKTAKLLKRTLLRRGLGQHVAKELRALIYNAWVPDRALEELAAAPPDVIVERLSLFGHVGVDLAEKLDVPLVLEVNAPLAEEAGCYRSLQLTELARETEERVLGRADAVTVVSEPLADHLAGTSRDRRRFHVIPNGADVDIFDRTPTRAECRAAAGLGDEFVVGFVGSLKPWHGVDLLVEAFGGIHKEDGSARLLIVGDGPENERLRRQADEAGLNGSVTFAGALTHERVPHLLRAMDVAVAPFREVPDFYFSPIKLFEYMASGTCVVASRLGQIAEVVEDGVNGFLTAPGDAGELRRMIGKLRRSPHLCDSAGVRAAETVRANYTWSHSARALSSVLEDVVARRRLRSTGYLVRSR